MRRVFLALMFAGVAFPCMASEMEIIYLYSDAGFVGKNADLEAAIGVALKTHFSFKKKADRISYSSFMIEPELRLEYDASNKIRAQGSLYFGSFAAVLLTSFHGYAGASGIFMHDFERDINDVGIAPVIGVEGGIGIIFSRGQLQYEWYTDKRYNRFSIIAAIGVMFW